MGVGLGVWVFNSFFPIFGLRCLPLCVPGSQLENYDKRKISPWMHFPHHSTCEGVSRDKA